MSAIYVNTEVEVNVEEVLPHVQSDHLFKEVERRGFFVHNIAGLRVISSDNIVITKQRTNRDVMCDILGIGYHAQRDEFIKAFNEFLRQS